MVMLNNYKKVSDVVADFLKEKKIEVVFGIIGSANAHIFDSISKLGYTKIINMHHEQAVVLAMGAYYRASGKPSVAIVTAGAGASNAVTGVISNWADSIPGIIISGQEPSKYLNTHSNLRMYGTQGFNIIKMLSDVLKYGVIVMDSNKIQNELEHAFKISYSDRPGPCWIDIPLDVQTENIKFRNWETDTHTDNYTDVTDIVNIIGNSKRPVIIGGNGIKLSGAKNEFQKLVSKLNIPTLLSWSGIDLLPDNHPLFFGRPGIYGQRAANFILQNSDLVIVIGSRLALPQVGYDFSQFARDAKIVLIDIDDVESSKYPTEIYLKSDCKSAIVSLYKSDVSLNDISDWVLYCNNLKNEYPTVDSYHLDNGYLNSYKFIDKIGDYLTDNHIIVTDMGTGLLSGHQSIRIKEGQTMFTSQGLGEMGYGLPGAIGAQISKPDNPVLCLNCDGGIMMNLQELHTIVDNNLPIKIVIFNNDGYLMIKHTQKLFLNSNYVSVDSDTGVGLPNFSKLMPAFGYDYYSIKEWSEFDKTFSEFISNPKMATLEVFMDPNQEFIPKVKGIPTENGLIIAPPIEDMSPLLSISELEDRMLIDVSDKSKKIKR
jgi:acetolactate synthase-1/2/3 large subunit